MLIPDAQGHRGEAEPIRKHAPGRQLDAEMTVRAAHPYWVYCYPVLSLLRFRGSRIIGDGSSCEVLIASGRMGIFRSGLV